MSHCGRGAADAAPDPARVVAVGDGRANVLVAQEFLRAADIVPVGPPVRSEVAPVAVRRGTANDQAVPYPGGCSVSGYVAEVCGSIAGAPRGPTPRPGDGQARGAKLGHADRRQCQSRRKGSSPETTDDRARDVSGECLGNSAEHDPPGARIPLAGCLSSIPRRKNGAGALNGPLGVLSGAARQRSAGPSAALTARERRSARQGFKMSPRNWASTSGKMGRRRTGATK